MDSGSRDQNDPIIGINVTPLVDVSLVLVIIFMIAAPMSMQSGIGVKTLKKEAETTKAAATAPEVRTEVMIKLSGNQVTVNDEIVSEEKLPYHLTGLLSQSKEKLVYISPADDVAHGQLVGIMDLSRQCGAQRLAIVDDNPSADAATASGESPAAPAAEIAAMPAGGTQP